MVHFCSRSLVVEVGQSANQPLYKYLIRDIEAEPTLQEMDTSGSSR